jgi:hypothetical protein
MDDDWFNSLLAERAEKAQEQRRVALLWARLEKEAAEAKRKRNDHPAHYVPPSRERNCDIWAARCRDGLTFKAVGDKFGITTERVRQIVWRENRRRERAREHVAAPQSRPIDMGGIRDQWQHWTPETNAIELGLIK